MKNLTDLYTVNQARAIIRNATNHLRVHQFTFHSDRRVVVAALARLARLASKSRTQVSPDVASLVERYGFGLDTVKTVLEAKGGDLKAAARSLAAKKARAARDLPKVLTDRGF